VFSENKSKIAFYPLRFKKKVFSNEYIFVTLHSLTETSVFITAYFKAENYAESVDYTGVLARNASFKPRISKIRQSNSEFIDSLMNDNKKRTEFMQSIKDLREERIRNSFRPPTTFEFINKTYKKRREKVLENKDTEWKTKLFNIYKKQIRTDLKHKLNGIKKEIKFKNIKI